MEKTTSDSEAWRGPRLTRRPSSTMRLVKVPERGVTLPEKALHSRKKVRSLRRNTNFKKNVYFFYHFFKTIFMYCAALSRNRGLDPDEAKLFQMPSQWCPVYITKLANFILKYKTYKDHLHTPTSPPISPISKHTISFLVFHGSKGCSHRQLNGRRCGGQGRARIRRNG